MFLALTMLHRFPILKFITTDLLAVGSYMLADEWCSWCQDVKEDECRDGTCQQQDQHPGVDLASLYHFPDVDFGGAE